MLGNSGENVAASSGDQQTRHDAAPTFEQLQANDVDVVRSQQSSHTDTVTAPSAIPRAT